MEALSILDLKDPEPIQKQPESDPEALIDNGQLSTYLIGLLVIVQGFLISNPELIESFLAKYGLLAYAPLILSIIVFTFDYLNPRQGQ